MTADSKGFTLIELVIVIVLVGVLSVAALPRFINFSAESSAASVTTIFQNFRTGVTIYQSACLARGGDIVSNIAGTGVDFTIDGINSNYSGSCYPVIGSHAGSTRAINRPDTCFDVLETITQSDYFDDHPSFSSTNPRLGGENAESVDVSLLPDAIENGYLVFIHQRRRYASYCHFYSIGGDLSDAPFILYNAVDGQLVTGRRDLTQNFTWTEELERYTGDITLP